MEVMEAPIRRDSLASECISFRSGSTSGEAFEENLDEMSESELRTLLCDLEKRNRTLATEIGMMEAFLKKQQAMEASLSTRNRSMDSKSKAPLLRDTSSSSSTEKSRIPTSLNVGQKKELVSGALMKCHEEAEDLEDKMEFGRGEMEIAIDVAESQLGDVRRSREKFLSTVQLWTETILMEDRDGESVPITRYPTEPVQKLLEGELKGKKGEEEREKLRGMELRREMKKKSEVLKAKEDLRKVFSPVDLAAMPIRIQKFHERLVKHEAKSRTLKDSLRRARRLVKDFKDKVKSEEEMHRSLENTRKDLLRILDSLTAAESNQEVKVGGRSSISSKGYQITVEDLQAVNKEFHRLSLAEKHLQSKLTRSRIKRKFANRRNSNKTSVVRQKNPLLISRDKAKRTIMMGSKRTEK
ncbi:unnamed protein product [Darwinula stevensoni]|uniref:Uncharacterized protein n=1 Tax=Darwinula stevensoni TaxID=69355 RepID=A0A7R8XBL6_9CRUS|nr:unnamed protein product [Darwinula stevensoni]CAG0891342.1 unnamed protein product [Darwinula stevensoni]